MKNYLKMTLLAGILILSVLAISNASAISQYYTYSPASSGYIDITDSVSYNEDVIGESRGFSLTRKSTAPRADIVRGCDYYDWTSNYRKCKSTAQYSEGYIDSYSYDNYDRYHYDNFRAYYDQDKALDKAFKTYQQSSKQQFQLESQRITLKNQRRYGGYGSGYMRYSWGW